MLKARHINKNEVGEGRMELLKARQSLRAARPFKEHYMMLYKTATSGIED